LLDAAAAADGLVIDVHSWMIALVVFNPAAASLCEAIWTKMVGIG